MLAAWRTWALKPRVAHRIMSQPNRIRQVARLPGVRGKYIMLSRLLPGPCVCDAQIQIAVKLLHEKTPTLTR